MAEVAEHVIRVLWLREITHVARIAVRVLQLIVAVHMAILTQSLCVPPGQRKIRRRMIKRGGTPRILRVTRQAVVTELSLLMVGICGAIEICSMAIPACVRQILILIIHVTLIARNRQMRADKRVVCIRVVKRRRKPRRTCVARCTIMAEVAQHMVRVLRL